MTWGGTLRRLLAAVVRREVGQDMIEYALLISLITIPLILAIVAIGPYIQNTFEDAVNALASA
jgi:Flp pilus assembly pilin Flp